MNQHQKDIIRVTVDEMARTLIEIADIQAARTEKELGRKLSDQETKQIAEDVQRIAKSAAVAHGARSSASMTQDRRLSGYNYARS